MRVLVVDDEPIARRRLIRMLEQIADVDVVGEAGDVASAREHLRAQRPDLVLLDIEMPGQSGLDLAASAADLPPIIFTTAYKQYAVEAFEVSAVDYLVKPIVGERLAAAIDKVRQRTGAVDSSRLTDLLDRLEAKATPSPPARLQARVGGATRLIDPAEVTRICASEKYTLLRHEGRELVLDESLNTLEERLGASGFLRVHRSELVNLAHVRALHADDGATSVELSDGQRAAVSRRMASTLRKRLGITRSRDEGFEVESASDVERRLAAILSADAVGYSRLMAEDEVGAMRTLSSYRNEVAKLVRRHRGRVVDAPGDNLLAEFASPTDCVRCAMEIQQCLADRNSELASDRRMPFRIGIHLGEVLVEGTRIYGSGVNIAARLESLAEPGAICLSAMVHGQVAGNLEATFEDLGEHEVKNIPQPVRVFRLLAT